MPNNDTQQFRRSERLIELGRILFQSAQGFTALELGRALGCHRSTIYRDIDSLSKLNVPIWERDGRFGMHKDRYITSVRVNLHESLSLYLSARLLSAHSDKHNPHVVSALEKLASALPESIGQHITRTADATHKRRPNRAYIRVLETFTRAWSERKQVRLTYYNPQTDETMFPTGVGMNRRESRQRQGFADVPHRCGDVPFQSLFYWKTSVCSPQTWGWPDHVGIWWIRG